MHPRVRWKRWATAVAVVAVADVAILLAAGAVLVASQQVHASVVSLVGAMLTDVGAVVPPRVAEGLGAILSVFGAGWFSQVLGPAVSGGSGSAMPALGGVLAAPVYTVVRRKARPSTQPNEDDSGPPPHRIYVAAAKALETEPAASMAVQEPA